VAKTGSDRRPVTLDKITLGCECHRTHLADLGQPKMRTRRLAALALTAICYLITSRRGASYERARKATTHLVNPVVSDGCIPRSRRW
jgi:hypothetical protein